MFITAVCAQANSYRPPHTSNARKVLKWTMIWQIAIAIGLPGFNDLQPSVTPIFSFDGSFSLPIKNEENILKIMMIIREMKKNKKL